MQGKLIVIAIGGNSLIEDPKKVTVDAQYRAAEKTAHHIADIIERGNRVVIVHGNGPQVGYILLRSEYARKILHAVPLDSCVADTQGAIGYQLQKALDNEFIARGMSNRAVTVVTQVEVDPADPSFGNPTKPIGSFMTEEDALEHQKNFGWAVKEDAGRGWRRVVPSPKPQSIIETGARQIFVQTLTDTEVLYIPVAALNTLRNRNSGEVYKFMNAGLINYIQYLEEQMLMLHMSAKERYEWVVERYPQLLELVSVTQLASYLNLTKETLYRIRSGKY